MNIPIEIIRKANEDDHTIDKGNICAWCGRGIGHSKTCQSCGWKMDEHDKIVEDYGIDDGDDDE